jgi:hypothetical protein
MKKVFLIIAVAFVATTFVACGPSAEDKAKLEESAKRAADSVTKALEASIGAAVTEGAATADTAAKAAETATAAPAETKK